MGRGCLNDLEIEEQIGVHRWDPEEARNQRRRLCRVPCLGHDKLNGVFVASTHDRSKAMT